MAGSIDLSDEGLNKEAVAYLWQTTDEPKKWDASDSQLLAMLKQIRDAAYAAPRVTGGSVGTAVDRGAGDVASIEWSQLSDENVLHLAASVPTVYGPWEPGKTSGCAYQRPTANRESFVWVFQAPLDCKWATNFGDQLGRHNTPEGAIEACDAHLRAEGARLVGPSKRPAPADT